MSEQLELFSYYMVRLRHAAAAAAPEAACHGLVEKLETGEKRGFDTAEELVQLLHAWSPVPSIIPPAPTTGQQAEQERQTPQGVHPGRP